MGVPIGLHISVSRTKRLVTGSHHTRRGRLAAQSHYDLFASPQRVVGEIMLELYAEAPFLWNQDGFVPAVSMWHLLDSGVVRDYENFFEGPGGLPFWQCRKKAGKMVRLRR